MEIGYFGKLPSHGDFIHRRVDGRVLAQWDRWLQEGLQSSRQALGNDWLDIYLTSPAWRFCVGRGVLDEHTHAGLLVPSVDRVGRYFPFTVLLRLDDEQEFCDFSANLDRWYVGVEELALRALNANRNDLESLDTQLQSFATFPRQAEVRASRSRTESRNTIITGSLNMEPGNGPAFLPLLLLDQAHRSFWWTGSADCMAPTTLWVEGLPDMGMFRAMLDGQWQHNDARRIDILTEAMEQAYTQLELPTISNLP